jgi:hypothetical protein
MFICLYRFILLHGSLFLRKKLFNLQPLSHTYDITCKKEGNASDLVTFAYSSIWYLFYGVYSTVYCTIKIKKMSHGWQKK